jgi:hypothetical protein
MVQPIGAESIPKIFRKSEPFYKIILLQNHPFPKLKLRSFSSSAALAVPHATAAPPGASYMPLTRFSSSSGFSEPIADTLLARAHRVGHDSMPIDTAPAGPTVNLVG